MTTPLTQIDLDQYKRQAKELLKSARAASPPALSRIREHHPEGNALLSSPNLKLADTQLVIARENGASSWAKFKSYVLFRNAVDALDKGDLVRLNALLDSEPSILTYRCMIGEWYESGYFSGAGLLQHIAGNPIRCPLPGNIVEITRTLLKHKADPNTNPTTISLLLTSKQASEAGVAVELIDLLRNAGATHPIDLQDPKVLDDPIWNGGLATAEELARRGAKMDLPQAAALGRVDKLQAIVRECDISSELMEVALIYACVTRQIESVRFLIQQGAKGDVIPKAGQRGGGQATALHNAANRGFTEIVTLLLENGAKTHTRDLQWNGTPADWAKHGGHLELAELLEKR